MDYNKLLEEYNKLKEENLHLKELLKKNNITYNFVEKSKLSLIEKISIFKSYFKGNSSVFAEKYYKKDGSKGYFVVCENKNTSLCKIKTGILKPCSNCLNKQYANLKDEYLYEHMKGIKSYGIYPIVDNDKCFFLAIDFDDDEIEKAAIAYRNECKKLGIDAVIELSQSAKGAHVWIFFGNLVYAKKARLVGDYILLNAMSANKSISFKSYDRFLPSQDMVDKNGYGNCIALPLQGCCVKNKTSVFVDDNFQMISKQIEYLSNVSKVSDIELDLLFDSIIVNNELLEIDRKQIKKTGLMKSDFSNIFKVIIDDDIYFSKNGLSSKALITLKRLAVLYNPDFYEKQAKRMSTYNINRIVELYKEKDDYISLPRGCLNDLMFILKNANVEYAIIDKRPKLSKINFISTISLYENQKEAVDCLIQYEKGILTAPTGSGKTVIGLEIINRLKRPTLILVDQVKLIEQWKERIESFSKIYDGEKKISPGILHGSKKKITGIVDIASIKSINDELDIYDKYEIIIGDEIHHIASKTYESIIRKFKARYVYGLTATPKRSDHLEKIVYKSIGDIRFEMKKQNSTFEKILKPRFTKFKKKDDYNLMTYTDLCTELYKNDERNCQIIEDIIMEYTNLRNIIVLTERNEHIDILYDLLKIKCNNVFKSKGTDNAKNKKAFNEQIKQIDSQYVIISTSKYLGEGFDLPSLDTLFLTMPFKWSGKVSQALGRIGRIHDGKKQVIVYDYVDIKMGLFAHQFQLRLKAYKSDDYLLCDDNEKTSILYSYNNYTFKLYDDIQSAKKIKFYCNYYVKDKMDELLALNNNIEIISDLDIDGRVLIKKHSEINAIVIDDEIIWYGSINPFSWAKKGDTIIRLVDMEYVKEIFNE